VALNSCLGSFASRGREGDQRSGWAFPFGGTLLQLWGGIEIMKETCAINFSGSAWFMVRGPISQFRPCALFVFQAGYVIVG
jgi:hypothetical protein